MQPRPISAISGPCAPRRRRRSVGALPGFELMGRVSRNSRRPSRQAGIFRRVRSGGVLELGRHFVMPRPVRSSPSPDACFPRLLVRRVCRQPDPPVFIPARGVVPHFWVRIVRGRGESDQGHRVSRTGACREARSLRVRPRCWHGRDRWLLVGVIGRTWVARDPKAALAWAHALPAGTPREAALAGIDAGLGIASFRSREVADTLA